MNSMTFHTRRPAPSAPQGPSLFGLKWPWLENWGVNVLVWAFPFKHIRNIWNIFEAKADRRLPCVLIEHLVHFGCEVYDAFTVKSEKMVVKSPGDLAAEWHTAGPLKVGFYDKFEHGFRLYYKCFIFFPLTTEKVSWFFHEGITLEH